MSAGLFIVLEAGLNLLAAGLERQAILDKVHVMQSQGATPEQIAEALRNMRKAAEADAQAAIDKN